MNKPCISVFRVGRQLFSARVMTMLYLDGDTDGAALAPKGLPGVGMP